MSKVVSGLVSIITPTHNRSAFLKRLKSFVSTQTYPDIEWLILDDGATPDREIACDARLRILYEHVADRLTIGEKRNRLVSQARGEYIVQFDDDDYYAPAYINTMISALKEFSADLINLKGWFLIDLRSDFFGYWDLIQNIGLHFCCDAQGTSSIFFDNAAAQALTDNEYGYGFSYAFRRSVWESCKFPAINLGEDSSFFIQARRAFKSISLYDDAGLCLHTLHRGSTSRCFPQYRLPNFLRKKMFPEAAYLIPKSADATEPSSKKPAI